MFASARNVEIKKLFVWLDFTVDGCKMLVNYQWFLKLLQHVLFDTVHRLN